MDVCIHVFTSLFAADLHRCQADEWNGQRAKLADLGFSLAVLVMPGACNY